jgi:hypothetical protein
MSKARNLADLLDASGDVVSGALDNVPPSNDASALTTGTLPVERVPYVGRRNLIINGAMQVAQRGTSAVTATSSGVFTTDRFKCFQSSGSTGSWTTEQSTDAPAGFSSSTKATVASTQSFSTGIAWQLVHQIEGNNFISTAWGTSSAKDVTLSFWVKSSVTGAYSVSLHNDGYTKNYVTNYSISSANTWEYKTIVVPGETSGTWLTTNGIGCSLRFNLGCSDSLTGATGSWGSSLFLQGTGAVDWGSNSGATFYLTGVQLEVGSVATPFEHRSYGEELALCQRYLPAWNGVQPISNAFFFSTTSVGTNITFPVPTRVPPSGIIVSNATHFRFDTVSPYAISSLSFYDAGTKTALITGVVSGAPLNAAGRFLATNSSSQLLFTGCEL